MTIAILILIIVLIILQIVTLVLKHAWKYGGYYFITYATQKRGGAPIFHQTVIQGPPVDWILKRSKEDKSIYYRLLYADQDNRYKGIMTLQNGGE